MRGEALRKVVLADLPVRTFLASQRHLDDLLREFSLIALDREQGGGAAVPTRLLRLVGDWRSRFAGPRAAALDQLAAAAERGDDLVTVTVHVPVSAGEALEALQAVCEAADEFCRSGDLLTLAASEDVVAFRRRMVEDMVAQLTG